MPSAPMRFGAPPAETGPVFVGEGGSTSEGLQLDRFQDALDDPSAGRVRGRAILVP